MTAKDDFELVKRHIDDGFQCVRQLNRCSLTGHENLKHFQNLNDAFNRLFTPRPLRELVAEGYKFFWCDGNIWTTNGEDDSRIAQMAVYASCSCDISHMLDLPAIPILSPEDMGQP